MAMDDSGAWLFGDAGRPLFSKTALTRLMSGCDEKFQGLVTDALAAYEVEAFFSKKGLSKAARDHHVAALAKLFDEQNKLSKGDLFRRSVSFDFASEIDNVELRSLPWLPETVTAFGEISRSYTAVIADLQALTWEDLVGVNETRWLSLFDLYQMLFNWLPFATSEGLLAEPTDSLDEEARKFELSVLSRSTLNSSQKQRWQNLLSRRGGWGRARETLDAIASEAGVSRERVRQVEANLKGVVSSRSYFPSKNIQRLLEIDFGLKLSEPIEIIRAGLGITTSWTEESIRDFISMTASGEVLNQYLETSTMSPSERKASESINSAIREARSDLGIIKLDAVYAKGSEVPLAIPIVKAHISRLYSEHVFSGEYAMVSRGKRNYLLTCIANQLAVSSPLSLEQLLVGISRVAVQRQAQHLLPPPAVLRDLLTKLDDYQVDHDGLVSGFKEPIADDGVQGWLVQQLENAQGNVMSKAQVLRLALTQGRNLNSIAQYISFSSVIRGLGEGFICLVGRHYTDDDIEYAERIANASYVNNRIVSYSIDGDTSAITVKFVFSTPFLVSGVLPVDRALGALIGSGARRIECCAESSTEASAKVSKGSNLHGFASIREHLIEVHGVQEGDTVRLDIDQASVQFAW